MGKGLKKSAAFLLAVCMIFSLFAGMPMSVKAENEGEVTLTGLVGTAQLIPIEGGDNWVVDNNAEFRNTLEWSLGGMTLALRYVEENSFKDLQPVSDEITVTKSGESTGQFASVEAWSEDESFYYFTFDEVGQYTITYNNGNLENNTITVDVVYPPLGLYKGYNDETGLVEGFIQEWEEKNTAALSEFYVVPKTKEYTDGQISYSIKVLDGNNRECNSYITVDDQPLSTEKEYTKAVRINITDPAQDWFKIQVEGSYVNYDKEKIQENHTLRFSVPVSGLVCTWPEWTEGNEESPSTPYVTEESEYMKWDVGLKLKNTGVMYFGKMGEDGTISPYMGELTIKDSDGNTATSGETISKYIIEVESNNEENGEPTGQSNAGYYEVYFNKIGTYRIYAEDKSFITVNVVEPEAGFYSSDKISAESYIDEQDWEYAENSGRKLYFAYKPTPCENESLEIDGDIVGNFETSGNGNAVTFSQVSASGDYRVYEIILGENFETAWHNLDYLIVKLKGQENGWSDVMEYGVNLRLNPVGLVAIWPDWDYENNCAVYSHQPENTGSIWKSFGMDQTQILYFGVRDAEGKITPIEDMSAVTISGNANIQKYEQNNAVPGFYEVTLLDYGKEYTFTYNGSSFRIYNTTPSSSGGGITTGGGTTTGGSTSDSNTTTETKPDGSTIETTTETKSDGTKVETITETKTDGTKVETSTETKTDGSKVETSTETKTDGSKTENIVETAADGSVKTTETVTKADGSATKTEKESETNTKGKEVAVTTTTKTDTTGAVTSVTEKSVIPESSATTSTTVTVKKDGEGTITSASANVAKKVNSGNKATVSASIVSQIIEAAGTEAVSVTMTVKDSEGKTKYKVKVEAENLQAGEELFIYKLNTKTGEYTMVNAKTYEVNESGNVSVSMTKKATYELVTAEDAAQIDKQIKSTIKPKKSSADVKPGKSTDFALSSKANEDNIKSITYTTSKKSVATVSKDGKITAKGKGTVTVKAKVTLKNGTTKTIKMTIKVK
ncbi:MAG: hypothetical protein PUE81_10285 [Lachnospiraceae bacterium]|nr:hypothetical protein [Lachnospiraceae bacterium]